MNKNILNTGIQDFILKNIETDSLSVSLSKPVFEGVTSMELMQQLEAAKKCKKKLPTWFSTPNIYYPLPLQIEQTSSELTAQYKAALIPGKKGADISGGTGVDSFYFANKSEKVFHVEINPELSEIVGYNFKVLGSENIQCIAENGVDFLETQDYLDWVYVDPSRRDSTKNKVFFLKDCSPNISEILPLLWAKTNFILIKTSPLLDIKAGLYELSQVAEIQAIAVGNEVKELLWILKKDFKGPAKLTAVILETKNHLNRFSTSIEQEANSYPLFSAVQEYLFEPHAAVLKIGAFKSLGAVLGLAKLHEHSHLYTFKTPVDFPGRSFKVKEVLPYHKKTMKTFAKAKVNVSTRNFKGSVASLRKKYSLLDGGHLYLFFTTDLENKAIVIVCEKF